MRALVNKLLHFFSDRIPNFTHLRHDLFIGACKSFDSGRYREPR
jgi:hypothetical protein